MQRIHLDGLGRTKDDFVSQQVKRVFKATNFEEVKASLLFPTSLAIEFVSGKFEIWTKAGIKRVKKLQLVLNCTDFQYCLQLLYCFAW